MLRFKVRSTEVQPHPPHALYPPLSSTGLLNDELLPIDFRPLLETAKRSGGPPQPIDDAYMQGILSKLSRTRITNNGASGSSGPMDPPVNQQHPPSVMSQASLLLMPLEGDVISDDTDDPYIVQCDMDVVEEEQDGDDEDDDRLPPGIVAIYGDEDAEMHDVTNSLEQLCPTAFNNQQVSWLCSRRCSSFGRCFL